MLNSAEGRAIELECVRRLIDLLTEPSTAVSTNMLAKDRTILVRRAVDFMHGRLKEPLTAMELCAELGTSDRSLRRAFREVFGMGPLAYFRVIRLHAVRDALMLAVKPMRRLHRLLTAGASTALAPLPTSIAGSSANFHPTRSVYAAIHRPPLASDRRNRDGAPRSAMVVLQQFTVSIPRFLYQ